MASAWLFSIPLEYLCMMAVLIKFFHQQAICILSPSNIKEKPSSRKLSEGWSKNRLDVNLMKSCKTLSWKTDLKNFNINSPQNLFTILIYMNNVVLVRYRKQDRFLDERISMKPFPFSIAIFLDSTEFNKKYILFLEFTPGMKRRKFQYAPNCVLPSI